jgi:hypothetical protein
MHSSLVPFALFMDTQNCPVFVLAVQGGYVLASENSGDDPPFVDYVAVTSV